MKENKPRLFYIDNLRVLACFLVLLTHSTMPTSDPEHDRSWMFALSFIGSPSSELFLALSGTVLLPVKTGFRMFYKRRFIKLLPPLYVWSVMGVLLYVGTQNLSWVDAVDKIIRIPVQPAISVYWFVYAMAGLYMLAPYISLWLRNASKRQLEFFICLWLVNMCMPWIVYFCPGFVDFSVNGNYYWPLCYFGGFLGYWLLGYYLNRYPIGLGLNFKFVLLVVCFVAYPILIFVLKKIHGNVEALLDNLQLGSAAFVAILYVLMQNIHLKDKVQKRITGIAKYSYGIYLTHIFIARDLYWGIFEGSQIHIVPRTLIIALLTLLTGYLVTRLITMIPKGKYVTGAN